MIFVNGFLPPPPSHRDLFQILISYNITTTAFLAISGWIKWQPGML
jgi:hypothetical protein